MPPTAPHPAPTPRRQACRRGSHSDGETKQTNYYLSATAGAGEIVSLDDIKAEAIRCAYAKVIDHLMNFEELFLVQKLKQHSMHTQMPRSQASPS